MDKLLKLLEQNARFTNEQLAAMTGISEAEVAARLEEYEKQGIIKGYSAILDYEKIDTNHVVALIELKVTPKRDLGFEEIAQTITTYDEVESVYLMSGGYDLAVTVIGSTFKDIALFVSHRLAPLDSVVSTATHFVLSRYKEKGVIMCDEPKDERGVSFL
ncbi:MAG: transcriptional regulator, AsnC family [Oscillospiraceae bacterium]|jgi:DNA-binding Lrp family transcriptional regulator|nr:transcriptional regulator, AsnC family [Oscillospiraceae bacterium]